MISKKTSGWKKKKLFVFSLFTVLIIVLFLEVLCRISFHFRYQGLHTSLLVQGNTLQVSDSLLIFKNRPFYVDYDNKFQNNEAGMKSKVGDVLIGEKRANDFWVLLTGGSAMEGMGANKDGEWLDISGVTDHPYNETICNYLQQNLQAQMPDKKVKVFNGAASSYSVYQSFWRYMSLADKIQPDWVISMDGVNEATLLSKNTNVRDHIVSNWSTFPQFHFPINAIIPITTHSALVNDMKQKLFHVKLDYRLKKANDNNFPIRKQWALYAAPSPRWANMTMGLERAVDTFNTWTHKYDSTLTARGVKHLFLLQPFLIFRDSSVLGETEKALFHYYNTEKQKPSLHTFLDSLYRQYSQAQYSSPIFPMTSVNHWTGWVFVDYCHFTDAATRKIADEISRYVLSNGAKKPFQ